MNELPAQLSKDANFNRYVETWRRNPASIVFVPLAELYRTHGCLEEAARVCEAGLAAHPESVSGRVVLAKVSRALGRERAVRELLRWILRRVPDHPEAQAMWSAEPLVLEEEEETEITALTSKLEAPDDALTSPFATLTMATIHASQGDYAGAVAIAEQILAREPDHLTARHKLEEWQGRLKGGAA